MERVEVELTGGDNINYFAVLEDGIWKTSNGSLQTVLRSIQKNYMFDITPDGGPENYQIAKQTMDLVGGVIVDYKNDKIKEEIS